MYHHQHHLYHHSANRKVLIVIIVSNYSCFTSVSWFFLISSPDMISHHLQPLLPSFFSLPTVSSTTVVNIPLHLIIYSIYVNRQELYSKVICFYLLCLEPLHCIKITACYVLLECSYGVAWKHFVSCIRCQYFVTQIFIILVIIR